MKHLIDPLIKLGLTEKEATVYLTLLQLGVSTPYQIAKKAGIKRPTAYVVAEELVRKGLIVHIPGEKVKKYIAKKPENFFEEQEEKLTAAKKILPELQSYQKSTSEKPSFLYYEGIEGLHQAYHYRQKELQNKEITGFFSSNEDSSQLVTEFFKNWHGYREKHNIKIRGLTVDAPGLKPFAKIINNKFSNLDLRFLPQNVYNSRISIESCDNKFVRLFLFDSVETLIIESPKFAEAIKEIFELLWEIIPDKYEQPSTWK